MYGSKTEKGKTTGQVVGLQRKKDKEIRWKRIEELFDDTLTNQQNLDKMKDNGLIISEPTLQRFKRTHRGCQMVLMTIIHQITDIDYQ